MKVETFYNQAHLVVAAIRVLEYRNGMPPSVENICEALSLSSEQGFRICRQLEQREIIRIVTGGFGTKLFVKDHLKLEEIPQEDTGDGLAEELKKFQESKKGLEDKVALIKAEQAEKKKSLFAEIEKKLKKDLKQD